MKHGFFTIVSTIMLCHAVVAQSDLPDRLSISDAIRFALAHSPELAASRAEIAAANAGVGATKAKQLPQVSVNGFAAKSSMPTILSSAMGAEPPALLLAPEDEFFDANISLMAPLYTGGMLESLSAAARAQQRAAVAMYQEQQSEVVLRVQEAYLAASFQTDLLVAQETRVAASQEMVRIAQAQFEAGRGIQASVRRAEAELAEAQKDVAMTKNDRNKSVLDLLAEMGAPLDRSPELTDALAFNANTVDLAASLRAAGESRGELLAARESLNALRQKLRAAEGASRPQVYGFAMGDAFTPRDAMGRSSGYSFGVTVSFPLFDGGIRRSEVAMARAESIRAQANVDRIALMVEKQVRQAHLDLETADQTYQTAIAAIKTAEAAYEVARIRYETGRGIQLEQLDSLAALTRAKANLSKAILEYQMATVKIHRAVGILPPLTKEGK